LISCAPSFHQVDDMVAYNAIPHESCYDRNQILEDPIVTIHAKRWSFNEVAHKLFAQTGLSSAYEDNIYDEIGALTFNVKNIPVSHIIHQIFDTCQFIRYRLTKDELTLYSLNRSDRFAHYDSLQEDSLKREVKENPDPLITIDAKSWTLGKFFKCLRGQTAYLFETSSFQVPDKFGFLSMSAKNKRLSWVLRKMIRRNTDLFCRIDTVEGRVKIYDEISTGSVDLAKHYSISERIYYRPKVDLLKIP